MFRFDVPSVALRPAWPVPLSRRLRRLALGHAHVAWIYPSPNHGTFRYRVLNMLEALAPKRDIGASWFSTADLWCRDEIVARADVLVLAHCRYSPELADLVVRARAAGKRVWFDIDDLVFDVRYVPVAMEYVGQQQTTAALDHWFANYARYGALLQLCDGAIATNAYLAERLRDFCGLPTAVIPNFMNAAQIDVSERIVAAKRKSGWRRDGRIHLGYFSGSPTHRRDLGLITDVLGQILAADPRVVLRLVGQVDLDHELREFQQRIETFPMQDPLRLQRLIGEVEFNLVPLLDNAFTACKSELKYFEAGAAATLSIASPTFAFSRAIAHGLTGFLAPTHRWLDTLREAVAMLPRYPDLAEAAREAVLGCYVPGVQARSITSALFDAPVNRRTTADHGPRV
jgi:hypothetical protein